MLLNLYIYREVTIVTTYKLDVKTVKYSRFYLSKNTKPQIAHIKFDAKITSSSVPASVSYAY